jgi:2-dehydropantoate 2-reductase
VCSAAGREGAVADLEATVFGVIAGTAANRSSMLQDVGAGRPTEIDYITGYLLGVARRCGVEAPLNEDLLARVRRREGIPQAPGASR